MKTFKVAGVSTQDGIVKARFAKDLDRVKVLVRAGHTDIALIELPNEMTKTEAAKYLLAQNFDLGNTEIANALVHVIQDENPFKKERTVTVKGKKTTKVTAVKKTAKKSSVKAKPAKVSDKPYTTEEAAQIRKEWNDAHAHLSYDAK
jgi:hypothetical protein